MSLISFIATDKFISFMSDGRVTDTERNEILTEDYKKILKVNEQIIIGIGGNYKAAEILQDYVKTFNIHDAKNFAHSLFNELGNGKVHKEMHIFIGGLDDRNRIYYTGFSQGSTELIEINPVYGTNRYGCMESSVIKKVTNNDLLGKLMDQNRRILRVKDAKQIQEKLNAQVSMIDRSVGTKTFHEYIKK